MAPPRRSQVSPTWQSDGTYRSSPLITTLVAAVTALVMLGLLAVQIRSGQVDARRGLEERYQQRTALAAQFIDDYIADTTAAIKRHGEVALSGTGPTQARFDEVVRELRGATAVLLAPDGHVIEQTHELAGSTTPVGPRAFSGIDRALAEGVESVELVRRQAGAVPPMLGFVVPFDGPDGRRVLAVGIASDETTLGSFFRNLSPIAGQQAYLLDRSGAIIVTNADTTAATLSEASRALANATAKRAQGKVRVGGQSRYFTTRELPATSWRIVSSAPETALYSALNETRWSPWLLYISFVLVGVLGIVILQRTLRERAVASHSALMDNLTGIANRRQLELALEELSGDKGRPHGALMVDIDHFKDVNDGYGHDAGDQVLRAVADTLRTNSRPEDIVGRWGGEEFLVIVRSGDDELCALLAERLRQAIEGLTSLPSGQVTASIGVATTHGDSDLASLVNRADEALYVAKRSGRNRVASSHL